MQQAPVVYVKIVLYSSVTPLSEGKMVMNRKMIGEAIYRHGMCFRVSSVFVLSILF